MNKPNSSKKSSSNNKKHLSWDLSDLIKSENEFHELIGVAKQRFDLYPDFFSSLSPSMSTGLFKKFISFHEESYDLLSRLTSYAALSREKDQKDQKINSFNSLTADLSLYFVDHSIKFSSWILGKETEGFKVLDDKNAKRLFDSIPDLTYVFNNDRLKKKYSLSNSVESIISKKDSVGISSLGKLHDLITSDFSFFFKPEGAKKGIKISDESKLISHFHSPNIKDRSEAYKIHHDKISEHETKLFLIYQSIVKDWKIESDLRGYKTPISVRNFSNQVPDNAIKVLLDVCDKNKDIFQNYFSWKAKELGLDKLNRTDIYAPLPITSHKFVPLNTAFKLVMDSFNSFSPKFAELANKIKDANHIDATPGGNKTQGAFCSTVTPGILPFVLMNYHGRVEDVFTLAHELGHGVHDVLAGEHSIFSYHPKLPLAETASTFSELVLFNRLFDEAKSDDDRKVFLSNKLARSYAVIMRQNYFVKFEIDAHAAIAKGASLDEVSNIYLDNLRNQFGDSVDVPDHFKNEWQSIPHFVHTPFYCYAYNFGDLLSMSLYARYKKEGSSFIPKIEKILSVGGSENPVVVLKNVGIDISSPDFWQGSFDMLRDWQNKLESYK